MSNAKAKERPSAAKALPAAPATTVETLQFRKIPFASIRKVSNVRETFNPEGIDELAESIWEIGMQSPIKVSPYKVEDGVQLYRLVSGERRMRANKKCIVRAEESKDLAKLETFMDVPAMVEDLTEEQILIIQMVENLNREDVHAYEEAKGFHYLVEQKISLKQIAAQTGKKMSYIATRLKLLDLITQAAEDFRKNIIPLNHALEMCKLTPVDQEKILSQAVEQTEGVRSLKWNFKQLRQWITEYCTYDLTKAGFPKDKADLVPQAGPCTTCPKRSGHNTMLFADVAHADTCFDPQCFRKKSDTHLSSSVNYVKGKYGDYRNMTDDEKAPNPSVYTVKDAPVIPDRYGSCASSIPGVITHGSKSGKQYWLCRNNFNCKDGCPRYVASQQAAPEAAPDEDTEKLRQEMKEALAERADVTAAEGQTPAGTPAAPAANPLPAAAKQITDRKAEKAELEAGMRKIYANRIINSNLSFVNSEVRMFASMLYEKALPEIQAKVRKVMGWPDDVQWQKLAKLFGELDPLQALKAIRIALVAPYVSGPSPLPLSELERLGASYNIEAKSVKTEYNNSRIAQKQEQQQKEQQQATDLQTVVPPGDATAALTTTTQSLQTLVITPAGDQAPEESIEAEIERARQELQLNPEAQTPAA